MDFRRILSQIALIIGVLLLSAGVQTFAFTPPTAQPPNGDAYAPLNTGLDGQIKTGNLQVNALGIQGSGSALLVPYGNVSVGTTSALANLSVVGDIFATRDICTSLGGGKCLSTAGGAAGGTTNEIQLGSSTTVCNASSEGTLRYNPGIKNTEFCDGSAWRHSTVCASIAGSPFSTPSIDEDCNGVLDNKTDVYLGHLWGRDGNLCEPDGTNCTSMCRTNSGNPNSPYVHYVPGTVDLCGGAGCQADCRLQTYY